MDGCGYGLGKSHLRETCLLWWHVSIRNPCDGVMVSVRENFVRFDVLIAHQRDTVSRGPNAGRKFSVQKC